MQCGVRSPGESLQGVLLLGLDGMLALMILKVSFFAVLKVSYSSCSSSLA